MGQVRGNHDKTREFLGANSSNSNEGMGDGEAFEIARIEMEFLVKKNVNDWGFVVSF